jgi:hypothetical protein
MSQKKILILAANPLNTVQLRLEKEVSEIRTTLQLSANRDRFAIEARGAVSPDDLQQYMYNLKPQIVHFSGHGLGGTAGNGESLGTRHIGVVDAPNSAPEGLVLENEIGQSKLVSGAAISNLFALFTQDVTCVVLNACYSQVQAEAIVEYIPYLSLIHI